VSTDSPAAGGEGIGFARERESGPPEGASRSQVVQLQRLFSLARDLVGVIGYDGVVRVANPAWERVLGFTPEELRGFRMAELMHPEDLATMRPLGVIVENGGEIVSYPARFRRKDGSYAWLEWSTVCVPGEQLMYTVARDVSAHRTAEEERVRTQEQLQRVLAVSHLVLYSCRPDGDYGATFITGNVTERFGHTAQDFIGDPRFWVNHLHPDDAPRILQELELFFAKGAHAYEYRFRHKDGTYRWVHDEFKLVRDERGVPLEIAGSWQDITERKQAELLIEAQARALMELSTPLIPLTDRVLVMPLVGVLDTRRAQQVLETLLDGISRTGALVAILDITGVQTVDTQVASALLRAARAVQLLGAEVVLTGIRPEVAQTIVAIGIDLGAVVTRSTLQAGIAYATSAARAADANATTGRRRGHPDAG